MHSRSLRHPVGEQGRATRDAEAEEMRKNKPMTTERAAERSLRCGTGVESQVYLENGIIHSL